MSQNTAAVSPTQPTRGRLDRNLGPFEHLLWLTDRWTPRHFAFAARVRGPVAKEAVQRALLHAQRRHPALCAGIASDSEQGPRFVSDPCSLIPLRTCDRIAGEQWRTELESELALPFDAHVPPLVRGVLVLGSPVSELILLVHHAIGDGLAAAYMIRDLLQHLADGRERRPLPARPCMEELLGFRLERPPAAPAEPLTHPPRATIPSPVLQTFEIDPDRTDALVEDCRRERTTVQGALTAAFTLALSESGRVAPGGKVRCLSPLSVRNLCPPVSDDFGLYLASAKTCQRPDGGGELWDLARSTHNQIAAGLERGRLAARVAGQQRMLAAQPTPHSAFGAYRATVDHQAVITNIGRFPGPTDYGAIRLETIWVVPNVEEEPVVGVATVNRRMCIALLSRHPVPGLVENALARLPALSAR